MLCILWVTTCKPSYIPLQINKYIRIQTNIKVTRKESLKRTLSLGMKIVAFATVNQKLVSVHACQHTLSVNRCLYMSENYSDYVTKKRV